MDMMDRLANTFYLQVQVPGLERPPRAPHKLRIVTIDLEEQDLTDYLSKASLCRQVLFCDGIARPKRHMIHEIPQKVWVRALIQCRADDKVQVEILETSLAALNPHAHDDKTRSRQDGSLEHVCDAPWNQYAWKEEVWFRIHGMVRFGEPPVKMHMCPCM